jgi:hypothetical protein
MLTAAAAHKDGTKQAALKPSLREQEKQQINQ